MNKKIIISLVIIVIVLLGLGTIVFFKWPLMVSPVANVNTGINSNTNVSATPTPTPYIYEPTAYDRENCPTTIDEAGCLKVGYYNWSQLSSYKILTIDDMKDCEQLEEKRIDLCKYQVVLNKNNIALCKDVVNKALCELEITIKKNDWNACKTLGDIDSQEKCFGLFINNNRSRGESICDAISSSDKAKCLDMYYYSYALGNYDYVICRKISNKTLSAQCLKNMPLDSDSDDISNYKENNIYYTDPNKKDTDGDGLSDYDEIFKYKTDPLKPDTDADGYNDGEEVKTNHNPLGR